MQLEILYEDNHLIVVNKPSGWVTQGALPGAASLYDAVCDYLKVKYHKPGNVYLGVVSRLDALVSGVVCFARTSKAAARLNEQFRSHTTQKRYLAVVHSDVFPSDFEGTSGVCEDWLYHDDRACRVRVVALRTPGAKEALLTWKCVAMDAPRRQALLEIELQTGRKHQIRVQLASRGLPILGDPLYGSRNRGPDRSTERNALYDARSRDYDGVSANGGKSRIALHASRLVLEHPVRHESLTFEAPMPAHFFPWKMS